MRDRLPPLVGLLALTALTTAGAVAGIWADLDIAAWSANGVSFEGALDSPENSEIRIRIVYGDLLRQLTPAVLMADVFSLIALIGVLAVRWQRKVPPQAEATAAS